MSDRPSVARSALTLAVIAAICATLVAATYLLTAERIAANEKARLEQSLKPALAGVFYDSDVTASRRVLQPPHGLPGRQPAVIYRVYSGDEPVAALFVVSAPDGYSGPIRLLVGINLDGTVTGVRILEHDETPGLGDKIEQDRSDWVYQFDGRSLGDPPRAAWAIKTDGGVFDQLTGASITPRAAIKAIRATLVYFDAHRDEIFSAPEPAEPAAE
ncbi:MAG: electron transport complex subunit RsxG [Woeseiaceae bacterium]|nr:electron transport complex subunit RsxG [Woeseiaceae bacterium]